MKKTLLASLIAFTIITSCKKDKETIEKLQSDLKVSKKALSVASLNSETDSLTTLVNEFNLKTSDPNADDIYSVKLNSYDEARKFLTDLNASTFERKAQMPKSSAKSSKISLSNSNWDDGAFSFEFPALSLIIAKRFRIDWPSGFVATGRLQGDQYVLIGSSRWQWNRIRCDDIYVAHYGLSLGSSYEPHTSLFTPIFGVGAGSRARISFNGTLKLALYIKDTFILWDKQINTRAEVQFGPWMRSGSSDGGYGMSNIDNKIINISTL